MAETCTLGALRRDGEAYYHHVCPYKPNIDAISSSSLHDQKSDVPARPVLRFRSWTILEITSPIRIRPLRSPRSAVVSAILQNRSCSRGFSYQRLYFYVHVNREGRKNPVADSVSPAPEPDPDDPGEFTKTRSWWETVQEERVADGKRPPLDRRYVSQRRRD